MSITRLLNVTFITTLIIVSNIAVLFISEILITIETVIAQVPSVPSLPDGGDSFTDNQLSDLGDQPEQMQSTTPTNPPLPTIQITSHEDGNRVPTGELTLRGISSDNEESNCQVYADVNDMTPLQNATAAGSSGVDDYSQWTFTYAQGYQLITEGANELTAKISCFDRASATTPLSEWHSVNVTGVAGGITPKPTMGQAPLTDDALVAEQEPIIPPPITSPGPPLSVSEEPSENSGLGQVEGGEDGNEGDDDDGGEED
jgi:hypothetical protein